MTVDEGVIRETLPGRVPQQDPLDWSEDELKALSGEADDEAAASAPLRPDDTDDDEGLPSRGGDADVAGQDDSVPHATAGEEKDPSAFIDTRERKQSYTPEEWAQLVRQRDYFRRTSEELKTEVSTVSERVEKLAEILEEKQAPPIPAKDEDPAGYLDHRLTETNAKVDKIAETLTAREKQELLNQGRKQFVEATEAAEKTYLQQTGGTTEEFHGKLWAVRQDRYQDFLEEGMDEETAKQAVAVWEYQVITGAFNRGENPAAIFDRRFQRKGLKPTAPSGVPVEANGKPQRPGPTGEEIVTRAKAGAKAQSLGSGDGNMRSFKVTYQSLAKLSPEDFNRVMKQIEGTSKEEELDLTGATSVVLE